MEHVIEMVHAALINGNGTIDWRRAHRPYTYAVDETESDPHLSARALRRGHDALTAPC